MNVHHIPICTTFYFLNDPRNNTEAQEDDLSQKPIIDVCSQEEKLCSSRLSIVLNIFGDICGMTSLGALGIGKNY